MGRIQDILRTLFSRKIIVYSAIGSEEYSRISGRLINSGINYSTRIKLDGGRNREQFRDMNKQYDIYVKKEDEQKAVEAINKRF